MRRLVFIVFIIILSGVVYAKQPRISSEPPKMLEDFKRLVEEAKVDSNDRFLLSSLSLFVQDMHKAHIPNCVNCSLYLMQSFEKDSVSRRLIAARYAVALSPDFPDPYFNRFYRHLVYAPFDISAHWGHLQEAISVFNKSPMSLALYGQLSSFALSVLYALALLLLLVLIVKYYRAVIHLIRHITGFSRFYMVMLVIVVVAGVYHVVSSGASPLFMMMPFALLVLIPALIRERVVLITTIVLIALVSLWRFSISNAKVFDYDSDVVKMMINLYDPLVKEKVTSKSNSPLRLYLKGMDFFYEGSSSQALYYLKRAVKKCSNKQVTASIYNAIALLEFEQGSVVQAIESEREAWNLSRDKGIGHNFVRLLFEGDKAQEATHLEQQLPSKETVLFPSIYLPPSRQFLALISQGVDADLRDNRYHEAVPFAVSFFLVLVLLIVVKRMFIGPISVSLCPECGSVVCSECSPDGAADVCAVCQAVKQHRALISVKELKQHEFRLERIAKRRTGLSILGMLLIPGAGLIGKDHVIEGFFYLAGVLLFVVVGIKLDSMVMFSISALSGSAFYIVFFGMAFLIFLLSIIRTIPVLME